MVLGALISAAGSWWPFLDQTGRDILEFLALVGLFTLLFRVGLESKLQRLLSQIRRASWVWFGNVIISAGLGFIVPFFLIGLSALSSLFIGIALAATSVGVTVTIWQEAEVLQTPDGELLLDVAEMDDITSVIFMAVLFAIAPAFHESGGEAASSGLSWLDIVLCIGGILLALAGFALLCILFSRFLEKPMTRFFEQLEAPPDPMLLLAGTGLLIASLAGVLGFSLAIGAFFAGLAFSRDPEAVRMKTSFTSLHDFFTPFFFIGIGLKIDPGALTSSLGIGSILLLTAVLGKFLGAGLPVLFCASSRSALQLGISMIPRAEICLVVMQQGLALGIVSQKVYAAIVLVSAITCLGTPLVLHPLLQKWPPQDSS